MLNYSHKGGNLDVGTVFNELRSREEGGRGGEGDTKFDTNIDL